MHYIYRFVFPILFFGRIVCAQPDAIAIDWNQNLFGENAKKSSGWFLTLPVSAGALGEGAAASQGFLDATDLPFFPANTGGAQKNSFAVTHSEWLMGLRKEYAGALFPLVKFGTVGCFSEVFTTGSGLERFKANDSLSRMSLLEGAVGGTLSHVLLNGKLGIGGAAALVKRGDRSEVKSVAASLTGDLLYTPVEQMKLRAYVRNITVQRPGVPPLPLQTGVSFSDGILRSTDRAHGARNVITLSTGFQKTAATPLLAAVSARIDPSPALSLRSGYEHPFGSTVNATGLSAGIGFRIRNIALDAGWKKQSDKSGSVWAVSAALESGNLLMKSSDNYYLLAAACYGHKCYDECINYAKAALRKDPDNWMAHDLFRKASSALNKGKTPELSILYSGNFRGQFLASTEGGSMGGLARAAAVLKRLRREAPVSLSISTGNIVVRESPEAAAKIAHDFYRAMGYDASCLGQGEFAYGLDRFMAYPKAEQMICIPAPDSGSEKIVPYTVFVREGYHCAVISAVSSPATDSLLKKINSSLPEELYMALNNSEVLDCNLRIVVLHDTWENITGYAGMLKGADFILCAGLDENFISPRKLDTAGSIVVSVPTDGACVGNLIVRLDTLKRILSYDNQWVPLVGAIAPDNHIAGLLGTSVQKAPVNRESGVKKALSGGVFTFLMDREGVKKVAVKNSSSLVFAPMAVDDTAIGTPSISLAAGRVAFRYYQQKGCARLSVLDIAGRASRTIVEGKNVREALFAPDGKWIYCAAAACDDTVTGIYRICSDGGGLYPVVDWDNSSEKSFAFSPDSPEMVFCSDRDGSWQIFLTDLEGGHPLRLTDVPDDHSKPLFNADGRYISYLSTRDNTGGAIDLWVYDRNRVEHVRITQDMNVDDYCWLDNSRKILVSSGLDYPELKVVDIRTGAVSKFLPQPEQPAEEPYGERRPRLIQNNGKKKVLYVRDFGDGQETLFWTGIDGSDNRPLVDSE